jgi:hypothetical protein
MHIIHDHLAVSMCRLIAKRERFRSAIVGRAKFTHSMPPCNSRRCSAKRANTAGEIHAAEIENWDIQHAVQTNERRA